MKKLIGLSLLSTMLLLSQPFLAFAADTTGTNPNTKIVNFEDIESIVEKQNTQVRMNENLRQKNHIGMSDMKSTLRNLEDRLEDIDEERENLSGPADLPAIIALNAEKSAILDNIELLKRNLTDLPVSETITALQTSMSDNGQVRLAETYFIAINQLQVASSSLSQSIEMMEKQLDSMQLQESLGLITSNSMNGLKTQLVTQQTQLENLKRQQEQLECNLERVLNEPENTLVIGNIPLDSHEFIMEDEAADLKKALDNNYSIKILEQQINLLQSALDRAEKDHGRSSDEYKAANYDLENANLKVTQAKDNLKTDYYSLIDDITQKESDLQLARQTLEDKKVTLSETQLKVNLGLSTNLELDAAKTDYQVQENTLKDKQIALFNSKLNYEWFLNGMPNS